MVRNVRINASQWIIVVEYSDTRTNAGGPFGALAKNFRIETVGIDVVFEYMKTPPHGCPQTLRGLQNELGM